MNSYEKAEIQRLDSKYRPLGAWEYFGYTLLFSLPLIGFICLLIFCFSDSNINRRSFARSYFCGFFYSCDFGSRTYVYGIWSVLARYDTAGDTQRIKPNRL